MSTTEMPKHSTGAIREKLNSARYDLMPSRIVNDSYARVADFGAKKYTKKWINKWQGLFNVKFVTNINLSLPKINANHAILKVFQNTNLEFVPIVTEKEKSTIAPISFAVDAMTENLNKTILNINKDNAIIMIDGFEPIQKKLSNQKEDHISYEKLTLCLGNVLDNKNSKVYCSSVEFHENNIILNGQVDALSAEAPSFSIGITITLPENTEESFVQNITMGLDFWETISKVLKKLYNISEREVLVERDGFRNWEQGLPMSNISNSLQRHLWAFMEGEDNDPESGLSHLDHVLWNAVALVFNRHHGLCDDRIPTRFVIESKKDS